MALFKNAGSILKQNISKNSALLLLNSVRYMSTKLYVGGLKYSTDDNTLRKAFSPFGEVIDARIVMSLEKAKSRGFGFVVFSDPEAAKKAVSSMNGQELDGRRLLVNISTDKPGYRYGARAPKSSGSGGGNDDH